MDIKTVSLLNCHNYKYSIVKDAISKSIENLGGLSKFINEGDTVLLKVNLLMKKTPDEATTTHPTIVHALAELLIDHGANVIIGDSPGGPFKKALLTGLYKATGMEAVAAKTGATLNYNTDSFDKPNPNGLILKKYLATDMLNDATKVISVSKLKTHGMMTYTGAVKNMFGTIPGIVKAEYHLNMPDYDNFADALIDICIGAAPVLSFMDGIEAMEGDGPSAGTPRTLGVLLASTSPYHLDRVAAKIIGLKPSQVPTIKRSIVRGICAPNTSDIKIVGNKISDFAVTDFKIPKIRKPNPTQSKNIVSKVGQKLLATWLQPNPVFNHEKCISCNICKNNCPAKIIEMTNKKPQANLSKCIRCFCCQELCPEKAVSIKMPALLKLWH